MEGQNESEASNNAAEISVVEMKGDEICNTSSSKEIDSVPMSICFLVKEQAKSLILIQNLQSRMEDVENVQEEVIDAISEIRNYLCNKVSTANSVPTPSSCHQSHLRSKSHSSASDSTNSLLKTRHISYSLSLSKEKELSENSPKTISQSLNSPKEYKEQASKFFNLAKNKDSALESDKQDSGLDSDCRDPQSLNTKPASSNWTKQDFGDELLELLDEIGEKSAMLQQQLANAEQNTPVNELKPSEWQDVGHDFHHSAHNVAKDLNFDCVNTNDGLFTNKDISRKLVTALVGEAKANCYQQEFTGSEDSSDTSKLRNRAANKIDSAMVSSILKETNVVDLQRQVLTFLVENAVLQTKLGEAEQALIAKTLESHRVENSLKDETRLLMMENRELRIHLDEQKLETNTMRSKMSMLERVLQSVTVENRELNWQLGESLGLQNLPKRNLSSNFTCGTTEGARRASLPARFFCSSQDTSKVACTKTKLLSNASSFLDVTIEEQDEYQSPDVKPRAGVHFMRPAAPLHASTPMTLQKKKDSKFSTLPNSSTFNSSGSPLTLARYHSIKKRLKTNNSAHMRETINSDTEYLVPEKCLDDQCNNFANSPSERYPLQTRDEAGKFPFATILEKLKSDSVSKKVPTTRVTNCKNSFASENCKPTGNGGESGTKSSPPSQEKNIRSSGRKSSSTRNLHQRIQDILDRITDETG